MKIEGACHPVISVCPFKHATLKNTFNIILLVMTILPPVCSDRYPTHRQ